MLNEVLLLFLKLGTIDKRLEWVEEQRNDLGVKVVFGREHGTKWQIVEIG